MRDYRNRIDIGKYRSKMASASTASEKPAINQDKSLLNLCKQFAVKVGYKPLTVNNLLYYYTPITGIISFTALSVNVMNPSLVVKILPKRDLTNLLLVHTLFGTGVYIYSRKHLRNTHGRSRLCYSFFGATLFTFGSVLTWAMLRTVLPESIFICTTVGIGTSVALVKVGKQYMDFVDSKTATRSS